MFEMAARINSVSPQAVTFISVILGDDCPLLMFQFIRKYRIPIMMSITFFCTSLF
jgi:hypothetical protein